MVKHYSNLDVEKWQKEGAVIIKDIFSNKEIKSVHNDIDKVFGYKEGGAPIIKNYGDPVTTEEQFLNFKNISFDCSPALNLIAVHPQLISFAKDALDTKVIRLYQSQAWAKFSGETDFEQLLHCDYGNHTLTVPSKNITQNSITFSMYFSEVTEEQGPAHYVTRTDSEKIDRISEKFLDNSNLNRIQKLLAPFERTTAGLAGTIFAYGIDIFHRATNITEPEAYRYAVTSCFKKAGNDSIGYTAWPYHQEKPWNIIFENASPQQMNCFGVPMPGDPFWDNNTIRLANLRYLDWDMSEYKIKRRIK
ncbi:MAG: hypothetical protein CBE24_05685 [bacterium TMED264]|nr:MAG: hypothetical protein CBE24_05685 [bacterium TMED264]